MFQSGSCMHMQSITWLTIFRYPLFSFSMNVNEISKIKARNTLHNTCFHNEKPWKTKWVDGKKYKHFFFLFCFSTVFLSKLLSLECGIGTICFAFIQNRAWINFIYIEINFATIDMPFKMNQHFFLSSNNDKIKIREIDLNGCDFKLKLLYIFWFWESLHKTWQLVSLHFPCEHFEILDFYWAL